MGTPAMRARRRAAVVALALAGCTDTGPTGPQGAPENLTPGFVINGKDDFEHPAAAAIMVYDPNHPEKPGWRSFCGAALVHRRVIQTAGHCIQFLEADLGLGRAQAAWVSFQQNPIAHFSADPAVADPASGGWYEIASLHNNPDNVNFIALRQSDPADVLAVWGKFHDSGAIVLKESVTGIKPMKMERGRGQVGRLLQRARCGTDDSACRLLIVTYGLQEFPVVTLPPVQVRQSALLRYRGSICLAGAIPQSARAGQGTTTPALVHPMLAPMRKRDPGSGRSPLVASDAMKPSRRIHRCSSTINCVRTVPRHSADRAPHRE
jgi:hypothetical protein